ncbi:MAG: DEAD/DEAH box helicase, partial [Rhodospirillales bacterium]
MRLAHSRVRLARASFLLFRNEKNGTQQTENNNTPNNNVAATPAPTGFDQLNLHPALLAAVKAEGYTTPTPIQQQAIPDVLVGRDLLGIAQTGTGKTAAFALPILHRLVANQVRLGRSLTRVLVLSPTRELASQIADSFRTYGRDLPVRGAVVYGGVSFGPQARQLQSGVDIVVATPGRLLDLIQQGHCSLAEVRILVLDEADRMLDMGFIKPIRQIAAMVAKKRQTMLFSATMPKEIVHLADSLLREPVKVEVTPVASAAPKIDQWVVHVPRTLKQPMLERLLEADDATSVVVFTRTKHGADRVMKRLVRAGIEAAAIHGNRNQSQR